jgi:hypothetical protein
MDAANTLEKLAGTQDSRSDFSSVISGRTLSHVASLIAYTFKQTDLTLWENIRA